MCYSFRNGDPKPWQNILLGFSARTVAGISLLPVAVVKTRYEVIFIFYFGLIRLRLNFFRPKTAHHIDYSGGASSGNFGRSGGILV